MTAVGITLGDALAYRRPTGSGIAGWDAPPEQDEPGQAGTGTEEGEQ